MALGTTLIRPACRTLGLYRSQSMIKHRTFLRRRLSQSIPSLPRRHIIVLNRSALAEGDDWDAAIIHETWHTFQGLIGKTLIERCIHEGMATCLTKVIDPKISNHDAMFWGEKTWKAAEDNHDALLRIITQIKGSTDQRQISAFTKLNVRIPNLPGAPDRSGYYIGMLACEAWHKAHPKQSIPDLMSVSASDLLESLR